MKLILIYLFNLVSFIANILTILNEMTCDKIKLLIDNMLLNNVDYIDFILSGMYWFF